MNPMKAYIRILAPLTLLSGFAAPALAQTYSGYQYSPARPVQWYFDGGGSITQGETASDFDNGWGVGTGFIFRPDQTQPWAMRLDFNYNRAQANDSFISANETATGTPIDNGTLQTFTGFVDAQFEVPLNPWMHFYALAGVGLGYRRIELTQNGFFCDSFFCGPGFGRDTLVASNDSTHFAWNAGAGLDFPLPGGQSWFVEARYERIETLGPTELVPLRVGIRF